MANDSQTRDSSLSHDDAGEVPDCEDQNEVLDPNDSNLLRDRIRGQTIEHAFPPRLEDEGQSGG